MDAIAAERPHTVAAAAEVDEVEQREVLIELVERDAEAVGELVRVERRLASVAARCEQVREQRLEHAEPPGATGPAARSAAVSSTSAGSSSATLGRRPSWRLRICASPAVTSRRSRSLEGMARPF